MTGGTAGFARGCRSLDPVEVLPLLLATVTVQKALRIMALALFAGMLSILVFLVWEFVPTSATSRRVSYQPDTFF